MDERTTILISLGAAAAAEVADTGRHVTGGTLVLVENQDAQTAPVVTVWAGLSLGVSDGNLMAVALPASAADFLPTSLTQVVEDASGLSELEVCFAQVPVPSPMMKCIHQRYGDQAVHSYPACPPNAVHLLAGSYGFECRYEWYKPSGAMHRL